MMLSTYINERLHISSNTKLASKPRPVTKEELHSIIKQELKQQGSDADLNFIDTSLITDMQFLFSGELSIKNIKIDEWDVSNVTNMAYMFSHHRFFNCDLSKWDVSKVKNTREMFSKCFNFNCDLSKWDVKNVFNMERMFANCTKFKSDLSSWDISKVKYKDDIFVGCPKMRKNLDLQPNF